MIWRDGLLHKLQTLGIHNNIYHWIKNFLSDRTIVQVRVGQALSEKMILENGSPPGSVLSPLLFLIMLNDLPETQEKVKLSIFADDCSIWRSGKDLKHNAHVVQEYFDRFRDWCNLWGFKISETKTTAIIFTRKRDQEKEIEIKIGNKQIKFVKEVKFLGVIFDQKLTWNQHTKYVIDKCKKKRINLLRALSGTDWGANKKTLVMLYRTLIRSIIDYGCIAYDSAATSIKKKLNQIQSKALRFCCGAMVNTPVIALQIECGETSLELRRKELQLQYAAKLIASENNPTKSILDDCWQNYHHYLIEKTPFRGKTKNIREIIGESDIIEQGSYPKNPPWMPQTINVDTSLSLSISKHETPTEIAKQLTEGKIAEYSNNHHFHRRFQNQKQRNRNRISYSITTGRRAIQINNQCLNLHRRGHRDPQSHTVHG